MLDQLILDHLPLARSIAHSVYAGLPRYIEYAEIEQQAFLGLCKAAEVYDPVRGLAFATIAGRMARWSIMDYLRAIDPLSREDRYQVKAGLKDGVQRVALSRSAYSIPVRASQADRAMDAERARLIREALAQLKPRHAQVMRRYYEDGMTLREIGEAMGFNESRACHIRQHALREMREWLEKAGIRKGDL